MKNAIDLCFKCHNRDDDTVDGTNIDSIYIQDADNKGYGISLSLCNVQGDSIDVRMDGLAISFLFSTLQYLLENKFSIDKIPALDFSKGEMTNCYDGFAKLISDCNNAMPNGEVTEEEQEF